MPNKSLILLFFLASLASGDQIRLKSGGTVEGIIVAEKDGVITLDVGFGQTKIEVADIASTVRATAAENSALKTQWQSRYYYNGQPLPPSLNHFFETMRRLRALRTKALDRQKIIERLDAEIDSLEHSLSTMAYEYGSVENDVKTMGGKSASEQYRIVGNAYLFNASIAQCQRAMNEKKNDLQNGNPALLQYSDSLASAARAFQAFIQSTRGAATKNHAAFVRGIENDLTLYKSEFSTATADATFMAGNQIIVQTSINGRKPLPLVLDTGASTVILSKRCAEMLGIDCSNGCPVITTLANGETEKGVSVLLKTVAVGVFRAENVRAIVLEKAPAPDIKGLLGMSFLQRFALSIDPVNKKLILQKLKEK